MLPATGLYGHIRNNTLKSAALLAGFVVLLAVFWMALCAIRSAVFWTPPDGSEATLGAIQAHALHLAAKGWLIPILISVAWFAIAYGFHEHMIRKATRAKPVSRIEEPDLYNLVENLAIAAGLPMPKIQIMETPALNAYASGLVPDDAVVAVTRGLLSTLDRHELEAVLAHEITHIRNTDMRLMVVAVVFAGGLSLMGDALIRHLTRADSSADAADDGYTLLSTRSSGRSGNDGHSSGWAAAIVLAGAVVTLILVRTFAQLSRFAISRSREFMADAGAIELTKEPDALISALRKMSTSVPMPELSGTVAAMMFSMPATGLFGTHPSIEDRIGAIETYAAQMLRPQEIAAEPAPQSQRPARMVGQGPWRQPLAARMPS